MNQVDIRIFLHQNSEIKQINEDNEWLAALLSGEAFKEKKQIPKKVNKPVSSSQRIATRGI